MKAKIYPLDKMVNEIEATASPFCLHLEIICASLANGTSTIKNIIDSNDIDTTISWCKAIGANIKKVNNKLIIKGVNNNINYKSPLFVCNTSLTAKLMIPILCSVSQPFGVKANKETIVELDKYKNIFESLGVNYFLENGMVRFEKPITPMEIEVDGDIDVYFGAGLLLAFPLLNKQSILKLRAPVRSENTYATILKIMKSFHVDVKHPATMRYEIPGNQLYRKATIKTETDKLFLSHLALLTQRINPDEKIKVRNYVRGSTHSHSLIFDFMRKHVVSYTNYVPRRTLKRKEMKFHKMESNIENVLPFLMVLSTLNSQDSIITKVEFFKERIKKQYNIMAKIFTKLSLHQDAFETEIVIPPGKVKEKKQVDCNNNPYVVMAITFLALLSDAPIVIRNAECIYNLNKDFFKILQSYGVVVDFIYD